MASTGGVTAAFSLLFFQSALACEQGVSTMGGDAAPLSLLQIQAAFVQDINASSSRRAAAAAAIAKDIRDDHKKEMNALSSVPRRMIYWPRWEGFPGGPSRHRDTKSYLLFDIDIGGLNNIRLAWEAAGIIANLTGRTLVLPPATPFYLIDWGGGEFRVPGRVQDCSFSKVEDFISLANLRRYTRTLTFREFLGEVAASDLGIVLPDWVQNIPEDPSASQESADTQRQLLRQWSEFIKNQTQQVVTVSSTTCNISLYDTETPIAYSHIIKDEDDLTPDDSRLFSCMMCTPPDPDHESWQMTPNAVKLQRGGFVWHSEVYQLAAPIILDLGLFEYTALHARYGDLQYETFKQEPAKLVERWIASDTGRRLSHPWGKERKTAIYISTDGGKDVIDAFRKRGMRVKWSEDYFNSTSSPIYELLKDKEPYRIHQLKGPVEQIVCAFARTFIGTGKSTFTSYINQLRYDADAPVTKNLYHTQDFTEEVLTEVLSEIAAWEQRQGSMQWAPAPPVDEALLRLWREKQEIDQPGRSQFF